MQHTDEQCPAPHRWSRDPTHCRSATRLGAPPSDGRRSRPTLPPARLTIRSNSSDVTTLGYTPYPYSPFFRASNAS